MIIKINPIHVAETLAHAAVEEAFVHDVLDMIPVIKEDLCETVNGIQVYKLHIQDFYSKKLDYYFEIITNAECEFDNETAIKAEKPTFEFYNKKIVNFIEDHAIKYKGLGEEPIYEINGQFFHLKLLEHEQA